MSFENPMLRALQSRSQPAPHGFEAEVVRPESPLVDPAAAEVLEALDSLTPPAPPATPAEVGEWLVGSAAALLVTGKGSSSITVSGVRITVTVSPADAPLEVDAPPSDAPPTQPSSKLLNRRETARMLGCSEATLERMKRGGIIRPTRLHRGAVRGAVRYSLEEIERVRVLRNG
jgi:hypothetical protein